MNSIVQAAMANPEEYVVEIEYRDAQGNTTRRVISPIRMLSADRLLALCLCREEPRQFYLSRCDSMQLAPADQVLMPVPMS